MSIIGNDIQDYVRNQIIIRQETHGSVVNNLRTNDQISYLNSKTSWVKLASAVSIDKNSSKFKNLGLPESLGGMELAKKHILFGGTAALSGPTDNQWIKDKNTNVGISGYQHSPDWGIVPLPGIENVDIKTLNRGSIEKATVKIKVYSKEQFNIVDVLYLRLGYSVLLEWGHSAYISNGGDFETLGGTLIEDNTRFFSDDFENGADYTDVLPGISGYKSKYDGNYDGLFGKVSNFNWSFNPDGSYDITITIISMGDVIESLKTNLSTNFLLTNFVDTAIRKVKNIADEELKEQENNLLADVPISDDISAMLWTWKYVNRNKILNEYGGGAKPVTIALNAQSEEKKRLNYVGFRLSKDVSDLRTKKYGFYVIYDPALKSQNRASFDEDDENVHLLFERDDITDPTDIYNQLNYQYRFGKNAGLSKFLKKLKGLAGEGNTFNEPPEKFYNTRFEVKQRNLNRSVTSTIDPQYVYQPGLRIDYKVTNTTSTTSPLKYIRRSKPAFYLRGENPNFYLRFGALLEYIQRGVIPHIKAGDSKQPMFSVNYYSGLMYHLPNQISLDPRVCVVRNDQFQKRKNIHARVFRQLSPFRTKDKPNGGNNPNTALIMGIYLNFNFIVSSLESNKDERGNVGLFGFLSSLCDGLNKALGGINNLEPIVDKNTNRLKIIDTTPIPGVAKLNSSKYELQMYGYSPGTNNSNFVRNINLKTAITPEYATMVTVGATAGGYVKGTEATAFSKWNRGLTDRFNTELVNNIGSQTENEAEKNYALKFLRELSLCYGFSGVRLPESATEIVGRDVKFKDEAIDNNISIVSEFYRSLQASKDAGNSIGFIPFKLSLTLDGISGIQIYNVLRIDSRFLPSNYGDTLNLIVTGITHKLSNNDWETELELTAMPIPVAVGDLGEYLNFERLSDIIQNYDDTLVDGGDDLQITFSDYEPTVLSENTDTDAETLALVKENQGGGTRNLPLNSNMKAFLALACKEISAKAVVSSGGQPAGKKGDPGRTGSNRHDEAYPGGGGMAADFRIFDQKTNKIIPMSDSNRWGNLCASFKKFANAKGFKTSGGAGTNYMIGNDGFRSAHFDISAGINPVFKKDGSTSGKVLQATWAGLKGQGGTKYPWIDILRGGSPVGTPELNVEDESTPSVNTSTKGVLLMTGLTEDKSHQQQIDYFRKGYPNGDVQAFTHTNINGLLTAMRKYPNYKVVLFSAGCKHGETVSNKIKKKSNLFFVEPYVVGYKRSPRTTTYRQVRYAVKFKSCPPSNVQTGPTQGRGYGVLIKNPKDSAFQYLGQVSKTPEGKNHFAALTHMGSKL